MFTINTLILHQFWKLLHGHKPHSFSHHLANYHLNWDMTNSMPIRFKKLLSQITKNFDLEDGATIFYQRLAVIRTLFTVNRYNGSLFTYVYINCSHQQWYRNRLDGHKPSGFLQHLVDINLNISAMNYLGIEHTKRFLSISTISWLVQWCHNISPTYRSSLTIVDNRTMAIWKFYLHVYFQVLYSPCIISKRVLLNSLHSVLYHLANFK